MLREIHITRLFNLFDYTIDLKTEGITILTGPNGYGKTTILKIIHAIANKNIFYFFNLSFNHIRLVFEDSSLNVNIEIEGKEENKILTIRQGKTRLLHFSRNDLLKFIRTELRQSRMAIDMFDEDRWIDRRNDRIYSSSTLLQDILPKYAGQLDIFEKEVKLPMVPEIYLIREQRLLRRVERVKPRVSYHYEEESINYFGDTIEEYAKELKDHITYTLASYSQTTQQLDSSFPKRLFEEQNKISQEAFNIRFEKIKNVQKALNKYGLSVIEEDNHPTYKAENAKALAVYLEDTEKKLEIFQDLLSRLNLFTNILNERRFAFKKVHVSKEKGFMFLTENNDVLPLTELSSGEQQEVVLLFELLFKVKRGTLVLIDEPEISLHVAWQKEFLDDLIKITELQEINTIIATHSPQIINERWDLTVDLEELTHAEVS
ncbi:MAG: AAA family ATPase [Bacteroidota bacterium]